MNVIIGIILMGISLSTLISSILSWRLNISKPRVWVSNVPITKLVNEVILYTNDILYKKKIKQFPKYTVYYHHNKKYAGCCRNAEIFIYTKNIQNTTQIIAVTLHELSHYIKFKTDIKQYSRYNDYTALYGYMNNPLEIEAREFSAEWLEPCMIHLFKKGIIELK